MGWLVEADVIPSRCSERHRQDQLLVQFKAFPGPARGVHSKVGQVHPAIDTATGIPPVGPLFATIGAAILNALCADMVSRLGAAGIAAPVYVRGNIPGAGPHNPVLWTVVPPETSNFDDVTHSSFPRRHWP